MNGIDVSYAQGWFDWAGAAAEGVEFAIVKASQGRLLANPDSGAFADPRFYENVQGAHAARIPIGVYHYLTARTVAEATAEADFFLSLIAPYRDKIDLWAVCDAEEEKYLPRDRERCGRVVRTFLEKVRSAGYKPMLYASPYYLNYRLPPMGEYDLWLAYWGTTEARALAYNPKIWQYGTASLANQSQVDMNRGYFSIEECKRHENGVLQNDPQCYDGVLVSGCGSGCVDSVNCF